MAFVYRLSLLRSSAFATLERNQGILYRYLGSPAITVSAGATQNNTLSQFSQCRHASSESGHPMSKRVKDNAEVVVIGGGVIGTSVAYHLAKAGMKDVLLLEKTELTAGSSWHAAGNTPYFHHSIFGRRLHAMTINSFRNLQEETGQQVGFHDPGTIRLITSPLRYDEACYEQSLSNWMPHPSRVISADEVAQLHPFLNMDKVTGGLYTAGDGHVDPYSLTQAYATGARQHGAEIFLDSPVISLEQRSDGGWNVQTKHGTINAKRVINSAGVWAREVNQLAGIDVPVISFQHQYVVTASVPELETLDRELPVIRDLDGSYYLRQERTGLLVGAYESIDKVKLQEQWFDKGVPQGFGRELFENDLDRISCHLESAMEVCPLLEKADIQNVINGPMPGTPDYHGLLGPYLGLDNFWCCSSQIGGVIQSGGIGQVITAWIRNGEPPFDVSAMDPNRFDKWMTRDHAFAMSRESYGYSNHVVYPRLEQFVLERPTQRVSAELYERLKGKGAQYGFVAGWEKPLWFSKGYEQPGFKPFFGRANWFEPVHREYELVVKSVGITDLTPSGKFEVKGRDAAAFLDELVAGDIPQVGFASVGYMLSPEGKVLSALGINRLAEDQFFLVTDVRSELHDLRWMLQQLKSRQYDVNIENVTDDIACLGVAGPLSNDLLSSVTSSNLQDQHFPTQAVKEVEISGVHLKAVKTSYTSGEVGWELYHAKSDTLRLYEGLVKAGKPYGVNDVGWYALNVLRLERGFPAVRSELSMDYNALEADIGTLVNIDKTASFIGKESLSNLHKKGLVAKKRAFIVIHTRKNDDPNGHETVWNEGKAVGYTTSGCHSYRIGRGIAFAYVPPNLAEPGTRLQVEIQRTRVPAVVTYPPASGNYIEFDI